MLYRTLKRLVELGKTEGLGEKLDLFFAMGSYLRTSIKS